MENVRKIDSGVGETLTHSFVAREVCIATLFVENRLWNLLVVCVLGTNVHVRAKTRVWKDVFQTAESDCLWGGTALGGFVQHMAGF